MSWVEKMKEWGGGDFTFLSTDGETLTFIVINEPVLLKSKYKGKEQERIGCPVITDEGYMLLVCGKRLARKISKHESIFGTSAFMAIRHGVEGDINSFYELKVLPEPETFAQLHKIYKTDFKPEMIPDSIKAVSEILDK